MPARLPCIAALAVLGACQDNPALASPAVSMAVAAPLRPAACLEVPAGQDVQRAIDEAGDGAVCLGPGLHAGPIVLTRGVTVWGSSAAILRAARPGTVIEIRGAGARVLGLTIDGRGGRFYSTDAAILAASSRDVRIEGVTVVGAVFGFVVEQCARVEILHNPIRGSQDPAMGLRGDTLRIWETRDARVEGNDLEDGRDFLIWYSRKSAIVGNRIRGGRYGLHFMDSHDSKVLGNQILDPIVGVFAMYSRGLEIRDNVIAGALGAAGMGVGAKESGNLEIVGNHLIRDASGIYLDTSPMQPLDKVRIERNQLRLDDRAIVFHASGHRVSIIDNDFADNQIQVAVDGGGDAMDVTWRGNYFDDYAGYDLDGDGIGDVAYEEHALSNELTSSHPELALFRGTPALALVDAAAHLDPMYVRKPLLSDPAPRMLAAQDLSSSGSREWGP
ncbi:nitrous oxide reductase family maturation protein NosD [soil metagenome]